MPRIETAEAEARRLGAGDARHERYVREARQCWRQLQAAVRFGSLSAPCDPADFDADKPLPSEYVDEVVAQAAESGFSPQIAVRCWFTYWGGPRWYERNG